MWRNTKLSVQSEGAGFQPKHHHLIRLQFDSPEWTFYEDAISELRDLIKDAETVEEVLAGFAATEPPTDPTQAKGRMSMTYTPVQMIFILCNTFCTQEIISHNLLCEASLRLRDALGLRPRAFLGCSSLPQSWLCGGGCPLQDRAVTRSKMLPFFVAGVSLGDNGSNKLELVSAIMMYYSILSCCQRSEPSHHHEF